MNDISVSAGMWTNTTANPGRLLTHAGVLLFGLGSAAIGAVDLAWRRFEPVHQPIQAWSDRLAAVAPLAVAVGIVLVLAGIVSLLPRSAKYGYVALAVVYAAVATFPLPRLITAPQYLGHHVGVYVGVLVDVAQQAILCLAAAMAANSLFAGRFASVRVPVSARVLYGLCCVLFGVAHFTSLQLVAAMVPAWMPGGGALWAVLTGVAFLLAGVSLLLNRFDVLACRLLGLMLLFFTAAVLAPNLAHGLQNQVAWGGNVYNLTAAGSAFLFAGCLEEGRAVDWI